MLKRKWKWTKVAASPPKRGEIIWPTVRVSETVGIVGGSGLGQCSAQCDKERKGISNDAEGDNESSN